MRLPATDDEVLLLHNAGCSKSRATKALLEQAGVSFTERAYLDDPLTREELEELRTRLDLPPRDWLRPGEGQLDVGDDDAVLAALAADPARMQRPIVVRGSRAAIGRPPANVFQLFEH